MAQARYASIHSGSSHRSGNSKYDRDERRFEENNNGSRRSETSKYDRDEKRFTGKIDPAKSMRYQQLRTKHTADKIARGFTDIMTPIADKISKNTDRYNNPTASGTGSGRGGKMDREWENHKWVSRKRNADGKWIYEYGDSVSGGNNAKTSQQAVDRANLNISAKKAGERNTGSSATLRGGIAADSIMRKGQNLASDIGKGVSDAASGVSNTLSDMYNKGSQAIKDGADFIGGFVSSASDWIKPNKS